MSLPVNTTPEADAQIREIDDWWWRNRRASPDLFIGEVAAAFDVIGHAHTSAVCIEVRRCQERVASRSKEVDITSTTSRSLTR